MTNSTRTLVQTARNIQVGDILTDTHGSLGTSSVEDFGTVEAVKVFLGGVELGMSTGVRLVVAQSDLFTIDR